MNDPQVGSTCLSLTGLFVCAADDLDFVCLDGALVVELECCVFDDKGPDIVTEAVRIEFALAYMLTSSSA